MVSRVLRLEEEKYKASLEQSLKSDLHDALGAAARDLRGLLDCELTALTYGADRPLRLHHLGARHLCMCAKTLPQRHSWVLSVTYHPTSHRQGGTESIILAHSDYYHGRQVTCRPDVVASSTALAMLDLACALPGASSGGKSSIVHSDGLPPPGARQGAA
ncbi:unnamed protein product [Sphagnum compactum]